MTISMPFLLPGLILVFAGYSLRRGVHFFANGLVLAVGAAAILGLFDLVPEQPVVVPGLAAVLGLVGAALFIKFQAVGRVATGICTGALLGSVVLCLGSVVPLANWGGVIRGATATFAELPAESIVVARLNLAPLPLLLLEPALAAWIALGIGGVLGGVNAIHHYRVESFMICLLGAVLCGFGLGVWWVVPAALAVGVPMQWIANAPKKSAMTAEERATMRWKAVENSNNTHMH